MSEDPHRTGPAGPPVPLVDIASWTRGDRVTAPAAVDAALRGSGFLLVTGHGVPDDDRASARRAARRFFALPAGVKGRYAVAVGGRGWLPPGAEANAAAEGVASPPDMKETFAAGADTPSGDPELDAFWFPPNVWPAEVPELRAAVTRHMAAMRTLADDLLSRWTGGRWRSTRHRVLPPQAVAPDEDLVSLVFFYELDPDTRVEALGPPVGHVPAAPVRAADYLADKLAQITVS